MTIRNKTNGEILQAVYMTWTESEFPKDGEKFILLMGGAHPAIRPAEPYVIVPERPDLVIRPENSCAYALVSTTETGRVNLEVDGFRFDLAEPEGIPSSETNGSPSVQAE